MLASFTVVKTQCAYDLIQHFFNTQTCAPDKRLGGQINGCGFSQTCSGSAALHQARGGSQWTDHFSWECQLEPCD